MQKFKKPEFGIGANPVDFFNVAFDPADIVKGVTTCEVREDGHIYEQDTLYCEFLFDEGVFEAKPVRSNMYELVVGEKYTAFKLLTHIRYKGNYRRAIQLVELEYMNQEIPYLRVGTNYFKKISKKNRYGIELQELKVWNKDSIKDDHGQGLLHRISKFDDFCLEPDNKEYKQVVDGCYNLYQPFPHEPHPGKVSINDIPTTANFMAHVFGEQIELGYIYLKVLYEHPKQILPVLTLVSKERQTGKTTFLNWMDMIFGNNYTMISPDDLVNAFNSAYAYMNIIGIDEAVVDKMSAVEKIKSIATANTITVNQKMIAQYRVPFFGKLVITTNKETDFMRVDSEEIRFWVRKLDSIKGVNPRIESKLREEIPKFLRYLQDMDEVDFSKSRMVFTADQLENRQLERVKQESFSSLRKEIYLQFQEFFNQNPNIDEVHATLTDLKHRWFEKDSRISINYIKKVLEDEMQYEKIPMMRYYPFEYQLTGGSTKTGTPYVFTREKFTKSDKISTIDNDFFNDEAKF